MAGIILNKREQDRWKSPVFYQIYPRSFLDTTGSGVGDLRGISVIPDLGAGTEAVMLYYNETEE